MRNLLADVMNKAKALMKKKTGQFQELPQYMSRCPRDQVGSLRDEAEVWDDMNL